MRPVYVLHVSFDAVDFAEVWTLSDGSIFFVRLEDPPEGEVWDCQLKERSSADPHLASRAIFR